MKRKHRPVIPKFGRSPAPKSERPLFARHGDLVIRTRVAGQRVCWLIPPNMFAFRPPEPAVPSVRGKLSRFYANLRTIRAGGYAPAPLTPSICLAIGLRHDGLVISG